MPKVQGRTLSAMGDAIDQRTQFRCGDGDDIADHMGEPLALLMAIVDRREHRTQEQRHAIGY